MTLDHGRLRETGLRRSWGRFSADRIATQYELLRSAIGIILSSVCPSVCLWLSGLVYRLCQRVPSRHVPICPFRHFCCRMYCLATKCTAKKKRNGQRLINVFIDSDCQACIGCRSRKRTARSHILTLSWSAPAARRVVACTCSDVLLFRWFV